MYFERLLAGNVRHLGNREHDFTIGPGRLRRWNLLPGREFFLGAPALAGNGGLGLAAIGEAHAAISAGLGRARRSAGSPRVRPTSARAPGTRTRQSGAPASGLVGWRGRPVQRLAQVRHALPRSSRAGGSSGSGQVQCRPAAPGLWKPSPGTGWHGLLRHPSRPATEAMRRFVRLGGAGHRSGGVPEAIAPQV